MLRPFITVAVATLLLTVVPLRASGQFHGAVGPQRACNLPCYPKGPVAGCYLGWPIGGYPTGPVVGCSSGWPMGAGYAGWPVGGYPSFGFGGYGVGGLRSFDAYYSPISSFYTGGSSFFGSYPTLGAGLFSTEAGVQPAAPAQPEAVREAAAVAEVDLGVPADAEVWVQGVKMKKQTGTVRLFVSPALPTGRDYRYRVRATYLDQGTVMTTTRMLTIRAGERLQVDFLTLPAASDDGPSAQR